MGLAGLCLCNMYLEVVVVINKTFSQERRNTKIFIEVQNQERKKPSWCRL